MKIQNVTFLILSNRRDTPKNLDDSDMSWVCVECISIFRCGSHNSFWVQRSHRWRLCIFYKSISACSIFILITDLRKQRARVKICYLLEKNVAKSWCAIQRWRDMKSSNVQVVFHKSNSNKKVKYRSITNLVLKSFNVQDVRKYQRNVCNCA